MPETCCKRQTTNQVPLGSCRKKTTALKICKTIYHAWWRCQRAAEKNNNKILAKRKLKIWNLVKARKTKICGFFDVLHQQLNLGLFSTGSCNCDVVAEPCCCCSCSWCPALLGNRSRICNKSQQTLLDGVKTRNYSSAMSKSTAIDIHSMASVAIGQFPHAPRPTPCTWPANTNSWGDGVWGGGIIEKEDGDESTTAGNTANKALKQSVATENEQLNWNTKNFASMWLTVASCPAANFFFYIFFRLKWVEFTEFSKYITELSAADFRINIFHTVNKIENFVRVPPVWAAGINCSRKPFIVRSKIIIRPLWTSKRWAWACNKICIQ